jgi:hypothetical protein
MAVDVVYDQQEPVDFRQGLAHSLGLVVLREETHDHLQPADWRP